MRLFSTVVHPVKTEIAFGLEGKLPIDIKGTVRLPILPTRELVGEFLQDKKVTDELLCEHFLSMIKDIFTGIAAHDE